MSGKIYLLRRPIQENTDVCLMCGDYNCDEEGEPVFADPAFCSSACLDEYIQEGRAADLAEAKWREVQERG